MLKINLMLRGHQPRGSIKLFNYVVMRVEGGSSPIHKLHFGFSVAIIYDFVCALLAAAASQNIFISSWRKLCEGWHCVLYCFTPALFGADGAAKNSIFHVSESESAGVNAMSSRADGAPQQIKTLLLRLSLLLVWSQLLGTC
jgi:hypothetical protein